MNREVRLRLRLHSAGEGGEVPCRISAADAVSARLNLGSRKGSTLVSPCACGNVPRGQKEVQERDESLKAGAQRGTCLQDALLERRHVVLLGGSTIGVHIIPGCF